ncbi:zf-C3HC domain-containing protein [Cephalotus follicularis]|uniref:Zf-C3HC domain-containing protein n=1 Tax=Cephalotus follicularis TaxID=3775 RepID=A0A1Q3B462_CEPFO|nr:zf-C3HC domain-containing protein [Cephalotus follicularis]
MGEDSEKRFHSIMDKLFHAPNPNPSSSSGVQAWIGKKHPEGKSALAPVDPKGKGNSRMEHCSAPLCRPWDRGDLMRRVATFKSMTWFAKPKVVSAVNCARRGWVNVDMDIISCESCGARLQLSTPSSWTQQQVEKAALVFSLKLDNSHKLLCPWIDNACDETLAQFPPTTPEVLVDRFRERSSSLLQLLALPVVSPSAFEYMRSLQLEEFLIQKYGNGLADICQIAFTGNEVESDSANLYYQAHKLISLCGWEPRSLPYVVDCTDRANQFVKGTNLLNLSYVDADGNSEAHDGPQSDPNSVVLDCRLCGASVGLWAFSTVPRPVELFRLVGYTELNGEKNSETHTVGNGNSVESRGFVLDGVSNGVPAQKESSSNLILTIAGGPPPTKQNFKATISLPVIGRNLRVKFYSKCHDQDHLISTSNDQSSSSIHGIRAEGDILSKENNDHLSLEGMIESAENVVQDLVVIDGSDNVENVGSVNSAVGDFLISQSKDSYVTMMDDNVLTGNGGSRENDATLMKFDPIKQHRHFCPWIVSTGGKLPGWQQTLSALQQQHSHPSPTNSPPSGSIIKVDDPISSIRKLFTSPPAKRMKAGDYQAKLPGAAN